MTDFFRQLFDTGSFPNRWHCGDWSVGHGYLHILSDIGIWGAYTAIPAVLAYFILKRKDLPYPRIVWLFVAFIYSCGTTHLLEALIFWWPAYRFLGVVKLFTAIISWITVIALFRAMPVAMRFPQLTQLNENLERANEDLNEFASVVSHDLRAPLRGMRSISGWIEEDDPNLSEATKEHLATLNQQVHKMEELLEGILRYSRIGKTEVDLSHVDSHRVAEEVIAALAPPPGLEVVIEGHLPEIVFDEVQLRQVLQNLIANAIKHRDQPTGHVHVSCAASRQLWEFSIRDDGPGIDPRHHERIFKIFQSLYPVEEQISGVGLALVKKIVEQHGGDIRVESVPGEGSTFTFTILKDLLERNLAKQQLKSQYSTAQ